MTAPERLAKARRMLPDIALNVQWAIHMWTMYNRCADKPDILEAMSYADEGWGFAASRDAIHVTLVLSLMRIFDKHKDSSSLPLLIDIARDAAVQDLATREAFDDEARREATNVGDEPLDPAFLERIRKEGAMRAAQAVAGHFARALELYDAIDQKGLIEPLRDLRDQKLAHHDRRNLAQRAKYGHERRLFEQAVPIVEELSLAFDRLDRGLERHMQHWRRYADSYWKHVARTPASKSRRPVRETAKPA